MNSWTNMLTDLGIKRCWYRVNIIAKKNDGTTTSFTKLVWFSSWGIRERDREEEAVNAVKRERPDLCDVRSNGSISC